MKRLNKRQPVAVTYVQRRELMVLSSMVQGLKILKATGLPTKEHHTKQKPPSRITYGGRSCMHETASSSKTSPSYLPSEIRAKKQEPIQLRKNKRTSGPISRHVAGR